MCLHATENACTSEPDQSTQQQTKNLSLGISRTVDLMVIRHQLLSNCPCLCESYVQSPRNNAATIGVLIEARSTFLMALLCYFSFGQHSRSKCNNTRDKTSMHQMKTRTSCNNTRDKTSMHQIKMWKFQQKNENPYLSTSAMILAWYCPSSMVNCA